MTESTHAAALDIAPSKILIVDDVDENLVALEALLRRPGAQILQARSGTEALELVLQHEFALALVDVQMPEMDGFELAELMRGSERSKYIPIIFVTAGTRDTGRMFRGYETGAVDFLFKPIDPLILKHKTDTFIRLDQQKKLVAAQYARIEQNEALLRAVMDATEALVYVKDTTGNFITVNKRYAELLKQVPNGTAEPRNSATHATWGTESIQVEEEIQVDGETRTFLANKVPLRSSQGEVWGVCAVAADITHIKQMEAELERAVQAREHVLAVVSHDMRNFLQAIKGGVHMLASQRNAMREDVRNLLYDRIKITVEMMSRMIMDLMDMANIRMGRISVSMKPENIGRLIRESALVHEPLAQDKGITIVTHIDHPEDTVECDRERMLQVLSNVLGNAIKFTSVGQIEVNVARSGNHVQVSVRDSGPGIPEEDLPRVFDAYWSSQQNRGRGTGLGLYITKRIVEAHGTRIWIESSVGAGTQVHFQISRAAKEGTESQAA